MLFTRHDLVSNKCRNGVGVFYRILNNFYRIIIVYLHTIIWFQETNNNNPSETIIATTCSVHQWFGRPGFNPRSRHTKDFKKWYLIPPCLTLSNVRYVSRVKRKEVAPIPYTSI